MSPGLLDVLDDLAQRNDRGDGDSEVALDLLDRRQLALASLMPIDSDDDAGNLRAGRVDQFHDLADRRTGRDDVVDDEHPALKR